MENQTASRRFYKSKWFNLTLGFGVTAACLWWAFQKMLEGDGGVKKSPGEVFQQIGSAFQAADYRTLPIIWLSLSAFYWLKVIRWKLMLQPLGDYRPIRDLLPSTLTGFAFNNVLPAHLGEFVRIYVFSRESGLARTAVLSSIVLERIFDIIAILAILMVGLFSVQTENLDPRVVTSAMLFGAVVCAGLSVAAVYLLWTAKVVMLVEIILSRLRFIPDGLRRKLTDILETGAAGLSSLRSGRLLAGILVTSLFKWLLNGLTIHLSLLAFGIHVSPMVSAIVLGVTAFGVTIPSSPGYFGVIQLCFLLVLKLFVDDTESVFAASIYYHMCQWVPVTALGMGIFLQAGFRVSDIQQTEPAMATDID